MTFSIVAARWQEDFLAFPEPVKDEMGNDADERQTKLRLAYALNRIIARRRLTQADAAARLGINQPKISPLARYKLDGFSVERLMTILTERLPFEPSRTRA